MPGSWEGQYIRLEVRSTKNLQVPSERIPAGIYVVFSSDKSVAWGDTVTLTHASPSLSVEISYEVDRMLGNGEVIGKLQTSWDDLLDHGDEPFELSFPPIRGVTPSLTLKAAVVHACDNKDNALFDSLVDCEIARETDAGHARYAEYVTSKTVSHLNDALQRFQSVMDRCSVDHPDYAAALTNFAWARLLGYIRNHLHDIDTPTFLFHTSLALRPCRAGPWATVETYRAIGFSRFLLPPSYEDLQVAALNGPVIILIGSKYSCSAIIVPTSGEPHNVALPSIAPADLEDLKDRQMMKKGATPSFVAIGQGQPRTGKGKALLAVDSWIELVPATANRSTLSGSAAT
ncbi:hypothetical protein DEU56DRAFT_919971 [Suillus clintonianus]|uniref:uncharacterized protein n=1 Tax=Suillus clintonianus TaxID=1904413 RepID=UPI001B8864D4|nr:uncharacterized protein DEU56DRAFT_919971 [Suillus clintonianus]KAG2111741.1 hypothetical protein DEU56DRAFT_919971 [Suillus clintonianus]